MADGFQFLKGWFSMRMTFEWKFEEGGGVNYILIWERILRRRGQWKDLKWNAWDEGPATRRSVQLEHSKWEKMEMKSIIGILGKWGRLYRGSKKSSLWFLLSDGELFEWFWVDRWYRPRSIPKGYSGYCMETRQEDDLPCSRWEMMTGFVPVWQ